MCWFFSYFHWKWYWVFSSSTLLSQRGVCSWLLVLLSEALRAILLHLNQNRIFSCAFFMGFFIRPERKWSGLLILLRRLQREWFSSLFFHLSFSLSCSLCLSVYSLSLSSLIHCLYMHKYSVTAFVDSAFLHFM